MVSYYSEWLLSCAANNGALCKSSVNSILRTCYYQFLAAEGVPPIEIHRKMLPVCGACVDMGTVSRWASKCKDGETGTSDLWDNPRPVRPVTATSNPLKE